MFDFFLNNLPETSQLQIKAATFCLAYSGKGEGSFNLKIVSSYFLLLVLSFHLLQENCQCFLSYKFHTHLLEVKIIHISLEYLDPEEWGS